MPFARYFCIFINVGLGEGAPAIGVPFFWPSAAMPNTVIDSWSSMVFLKFNGAKFSATDYPVLAKVFPALALPDARGDFIRIWDDGRGIDVGRTLLSGQSHTIMDHAHNMELWTGDGLAAGSAREGVNPGILATYGDGGIVKTDEPGLKVPSSLRALVWEKRQNEMWEQGKIRYLICHHMHQVQAGEKCQMVQLNSGDELVFLVNTGLYPPMFHSRFHLHRHRAL
ncbi:putative phage collar protein [Escherichia coli]|nr:putative phage collar protein [Escherichia coli]